MIAAITFLVLFNMTTGASPEPRLVLEEPPHHLDFSNDTGATLTCRATGSYQVTRYYCPPPHIGN
ncbi:hypothetical protein JYU34_014383 [Plutella xylostella]|uniref:Uncharacterized protein n=1 Tax=Plutella xylostella TaxID=51655 RepID=A0ABQ7Q872_PLUXY|nr:hypothetical protein JYU34_014383 [Plutella xylostella]